MSSETDLDHSASRRHTFRRGQRLGGRGTFKGIMDQNAGLARGPLKLFAAANEAGHLRLGISVSRRVGTAVRRNRIKRRLREAFRLMQHDFARGYDIVIVVRPHVPLRLAEYQRILSHAIVALHRRIDGMPKS